MPARDRILEIKRTLDGREKRFDCTVLDRTDGHLTVLFVSAVPMNVHGVALPVGTVTFGHFWTERPYNVYHWLDASSGQTLGVYLNVADRTEIADDVLSWRDLVVDVLVSPAGALTVLDEDELPADLEPALRDAIVAALGTIRATWPTLAVELEQARAALWPTLAGDRESDAAGGPAAAATAGTGRGPRAGASDP
jgi:hypothetical protein